MGQMGNIFGCRLIGGSKELGLAFCLIELTLKIDDPCSSHRIFSYAQKYRLQHLHHSFSLVSIGQDHLEGYRIQLILCV